MLALGPTPPFAFYGPLNLSIWGEYVTPLVTTTGSLTATVTTAGAIAAGVAINGANVPYGAVAGVVSGTTLTLVLPTYTFSGRVITGVAQVTGILDTSRLLGATVNGIGVTSSQTVTSIITPSVAPTPELPKGTPGVVGLSAVATAQQDLAYPTPYTFALANTGGITSGTDAAAIFTSAAIGLTGTVQLERSFDGGKTWVVCNIGGSGALAQWSMTTPVSLSFGEPEKLVLYRLNVTALTTSSGTNVRYRLSETGQAATSLSVPTLS